MVPLKQTKNVGYVLVEKLKLNSRLRVMLPIIRHRKNHVDREETTPTSATHVHFFTVITVIIIVLVIFIITSFFSHLMLITIGTQHTNVTFSSTVQQMAATTTIPNHTAHRRTIIFAFCMLNKFILSKLFWRIINICTCKSQIARVTVQK